MVGGGLIKEEGRDGKKRSGFEGLLVKDEAAPEASARVVAKRLKLQDREIHLGENRKTQNLHLCQRGKQERK